MAPGGILEPKPTRPSFFENPPIWTDKMALNVANADVCVREFVMCPSASVFPFETPADDNPLMFHSSKAVSISGFEPRDVRPITLFWHVKEVVTALLPGQQLQEMITVFSFSTLFQNHWPKKHSLLNLVPRCPPPLL